MFRNSDFVLRIFLQFLRRELDRIDDLVVTGAAADITRDRFLDFLRCRRLGPIEQRFHRHYESRRAVAALHRARVDERLLHRVQFIAVGESFDRRDFRTIGIRGHGHARVDRFAVVNDGAGAALAGVAAELAAFHFESVSKKFQQ